MKISVEQRHIDGGQQLSACRCPVALALRDQVTPTCSVGVSMVRLDENDPEERFIYLPPEARNFINDFDRGAPVKPFEFEIAIAEAQPSFAELQPAQP